MFMSADGMGLERSLLKAGDGGGVIPPLCARAVGARWLLTAKDMGSGARGPRVIPQLCLVLFVGSWASYLTSLLFVPLSSVK